MSGASDLINGLVVDGIIGGLGAVLGFVPQMAILFLFLSILEDCGYMVRICIRHGPCVQTFRTFRQELYSASDFFRMWNPWNHGF